MLKSVEIEIIIKIKLVFFQRLSITIRQFSVALSHETFTWHDDSNL